MKPIETIALCEVEGGPEYELTLVGESSNIIHSLSTNCLDFGEIQFTEYGINEFIIYNKGKVVFEFSIDLSELSREGIVEIYPPIGRIGAGE